MGGEGLKNQRPRLLQVSATTANVNTVAIAATRASAGTDILAMDAGAFEEETKSLRSAVPKKVL